MTYFHGNHGRIHMLGDLNLVMNIEHPISNEKTNTQYRTFNSYFCFFIFSHSTFDVGRSMFDVHLSKQPRMV